MTNRTGGVHRYTIPTRTFSDTSQRTAHSLSTFMVQGRIVEGDLLYLSATETTSTTWTSYDFSLSHSFACQLRAVRRNEHSTGKHTNGDHRVARCVCVLGQRHSTGICASRPWPMHLHVKECNRSPHQRCHGRWCTGQDKSVLTGEVDGGLCCNARLCSEVSVARSCVRCICL